MRSSRLRIRQLARQDNRPVNRGAGGRLPKQAIPALQRMETPVIYFYSDRERDVRVRVDFPKGLLTEFYPPPDAVGPPLQTDAGESVAGGLLAWSGLRVVPTGTTQKSPPEPGPNDGGDRYYHARQTDAALVRTFFGGREHFEKFLFYRGVGNFKLPVSLRALESDRLEFTAAASVPIQTAFAMRVGPEMQFRFREYSALNGQRELRIPNENSNPGALAAVMVKALVRAGLFEREATAMVETWRDDWFAEAGTRILYIVPRDVTDRLLPLDINPKPDKLVRVLVGRMDILTPENEARIEKAMGNLGDAPGRDLSSNLLGEFGRFAEPTLRRIAKITDNSEVHDRARKLLFAVRNSR